MLNRETIDFPAVIRYDSRLAPGARLLAAELLAESRQASGGIVTITNQDLFNRFGFGPVTLMRYFNQLEVIGLIERQFTGRKSAKAARKIIVNTSLLTDWKVEYFINHGRK